MASLVLIEVGLQIAALAVRLSTEPTAAGWHGSHTLKLLALGDSNTYGFGVNRYEAYPRLVETLWNSVEGRTPLEVINLGYPGTNSSQLRNRLPQLLAMLRPDIVTVMVGVNDFWTAPEPVTDHISWRERFDFLAWRYSRLYRALWMFRRALQAQTIDVPRSVERAGEPVVVQLGSDRVEWPRAEEQRKQKQIERTPLDENLAALAQQAALAGVELIFLTYPADSPRAPLYGNVNVKIRRTAAATGVRLIDLGPQISGSCSRAACDTLLFDDHPNVLGHQRSAALIVEALAQWRTASL